MGVSFLNSSKGLIRGRGVGHPGAKEGWTGTEPEGPVRKEVSAGREGVGISMFAIGGIRRISGASHGRRIFWGVW